MVVYITREIVVQTNKGLVSLYGQSYAIQQEANLEYVLERMQHYGENISDGEEKILKKAAYLLYQLAYVAHVFSDGNKRTALTSALYFLNANGYIFPDSTSSSEKQVEIAAFMKDTAEGKMPLSAVYRWLKSHVVKKSE